MAGKKYYWLKLQKDFFKRHDIRIIEAMPNGKDYILFYLKLLVESISHEGELRFSATIPYNENMLAAITNTNIDVVRSAMTVFKDLKMIDVLEDSTIYMTEVSKMIGSETAWAEKKRNQRNLPLLVNGCKRVNSEMLRLPNGSIKFVDEKRYGGNGMFVIDRAKGRCEVCGSEDNCVIHHNNGYSNEVSDLLYVCSKCHGKIHSDGGWTFSTSCPSDVRQELEKEKEIDKDNNICAFWEDIWGHYPIKKGKGKVSKTQKIKLYKYGIDQMRRCIDRYVDGFGNNDRKYMMHGSTFFNSGYVDYLDENYEGENSSKENNRAVVSDNFGDYMNEPELSDDEWSRMMEMEYGNE